MSWFIGCSQEYWQVVSCNPQVETPANLVRMIIDNLVVPSISDWLDKNPLFQWGAIAGTAALALLLAQVFNPKE